MKSAPRVFVLEDEPLIAGLLAEWLTELGCETVGPAYNLARARELIDGADIDAAILDVKVGAEESTSVADLLQSRGVPFAFATGLQPDGLAARYANATWLSKPYDYEKVRTVVAALVGRLPG